MPLPPNNGSPVFLSESEHSPSVSRALAAGTIRKLGPRFYTTNLTDPPEKVVARHVWEIVGLYCPGAVIVDRTAMENRPATDGSVFVDHERARDIELPGLRIRPRRGAGHLLGDRSFMRVVHLSSPGRAVLENLVPSRARSGVSRTIGRREVEAYLEQVLQRGGENRLNDIRDEARRVAGALGLTKEMSLLEDLIGALLGTRTATGVTAPTAVARLSGLPYDPERVEIFEALRAELASRAPNIRSFEVTGPNAVSNLAFFEAYFSNFIEGTEFEVSEAYDIVFRQAIPANRPRDAHDVLGTYRVVSDTPAMSRRPTDLDSLLRLMHDRHWMIMQSRPDKRPGAFKEANNRAGDYLFVRPDLVRGTLDRGLELYRSLDGAFARAVYMMFLVSEVHPYEDGNGRVARVMMNAELVAEGQTRVNRAGFAGGSNS